MTRARWGPGTRWLLERGTSLARRSPRRHGGFHRIADHDRPARAWAHHRYGTGTPLDQHEAREG
ncbi:hypothetical protein C1701_13585 [Actinoalloteichus sp. AHMU CJ021]|nr:hypothetical protein C1701_13585 [Actinoalloteichus sp. AHMU CJ021]